MPIELTKTGVSSSYLGSERLRKKVKQIKHCKKEPFIHNILQQQKYKSFGT